MKKIVFTIIVLFLFTLQTVSQDVGDSAPDFTLKTLSDQDFTLSTQRGKIVFIFFIGYACPYCIASSPEVKAQIINSFNGNSKFVPVVIDTWNGSKANVQNFMNSTGINAVYLQNGGNVANGWKITYDRLAVVDGEGKIIFKGDRAAGSDVAMVKDVIQNALNNLTTAIADFDIPKENTLNQNFPNPANENTKIEFSITQPSNTTFTVSDISGKIVSVPVNQFFPAGNHVVEISLNTLPRGIYFYKLEAGNFTAVKKMIVQ